MTGYVYAIECAGRIKLGFSEDPERRFMARSLAAAAVALGFMGALFWTLSATTSSPSLIGTGANATLGDTAPVPAFSQEMR